MSYNGWKNRATWNVALWLGNDEGLYRLGQEVTRATSDGSPYEALVEVLTAQGSRHTPDGVAWNDSGLDIPELDSMLRGE